MYMQPRPGAPGYGAPVQRQYGAYGGISGVRPSAPTPVGGSSPPQSVQGEPYRPTYSSPYAQPPPQQQPQQPLRHTVSSQPQYQPQYPASYQQYQQNRYGTPSQTPQYQPPQYQPSRPDMNQHARSVPMAGSPPIQQPDRSNLMSPTMRADGTRTADQYKRELAASRDRMFSPTNYSAPATSVAGMPQVANNYQSRADAVSPTKGGSTVEQRAADFLARRQQEQQQLTQQNQQAEFERAKATQVILSQ
jgi:hypothetical protein